MTVAPRTVDNVISEYEDMDSGTAPCDNNSNQHAPVSTMSDMCAVQARAGSRMTTVGPAAGVLEVFRDGGGGAAGERRTFISTRLSIMVGSVSRMILSRQRTA